MEAGKLGSTAVDERDSFYGQDTPYADHASKMNKTGGQGASNSTGKAIHSLYGTKSQIRDNDDSKEDD